MNTDFKKGIERRANNLAKSVDKLNTTLTTFFTHLVTVLIGFTGLLIGLKPKEFNNICSKYFFISSLILMILCIIFSLITLYGNVSFARKESSANFDILKEFFESKGVNKNQVKSVLPSKLYKISEVISLTLIALSLIDLILYVYYSYLI